MSLIVDNLSFKRETFSLFVPHLEVEQGTLSALVGGSGSGKTTLLHLIMGFLTPGAGKVELDGKSLAGIPPEKRRIAMLLQGGALFPHMTVEENVAFSPRVQGMADFEIQKSTQEYLERLQIADLAKRYPHQISGGQAQRTALARALNAKFPLLLLDEPFSSLDLELKQELYPVLKDLCRTEKVAMLLVTHSKEDVEALADSLFRAKDGIVQLSK